MTPPPNRDRVLLDTDVFSYGRLSLEKTPKGSDRTIAPNDRWIAACALHHQLPLVTNNARHFEGITGLTVITEPGPDSTQRPLL